MTSRLDGIPLARRLREELRAKIQELEGPPPTLASVHRGAETPFAFYLRQQARQAAEVGLRFSERPLPPNASSSDLDALVETLDRDPEIDGVIVEHPLPPPLDFPSAIDRLRPWKDADGAGVTNLGRLADGRPIQVPAVVRAAFALASHHGVPLAGQSVGIVGRSETVGLPLALLLLGRAYDIHATVTVAHTRTVSLPRALADCRVVVSCAGRPGLLNRSNVPRGAFVIDIGLTSLPDPDHFGRMRAVGDADAADLEGWAEGVSPVPGGVGAVTVPMLLANVVASRAHAREGVIP
jgi:methylenetetrahydrofolate dehydrogenase (NADP+)/methenyltetrahydrofolate cyclohydrolase